MRRAATLSLDDNLSDRAPLDGVVTNLGAVISAGNVPETP